MSETGERFILELIDWEANGDPFFYEHHHLLAAAHRRVDRQEGGEESWIYYDTTKFSGKKLVVRPGCSYVSVDAGVHNVLVWSGSGTYGGVPVQGGDSSAGRAADHARPRRPRGRGAQHRSEPICVAIKFFGPDVNPDVPMIPRG